MNLKKTMLAASAFAALMGSAASAQDEITVAYFLEWPMPMLASKADGSYDKALGVKVNWVSFDTGTAMSAAMASGDVQIAVSQGIPPFVVAASAGQDLQVVDIAVTYSENDNCVVRSDLEVTKENATELAGKKVAVPLGTAAHYGFLRQMDHFGVALDSLTIVDMEPNDGAVALEQGAVDFSCGYGGGLSRMKEHGNVLLTGSEKEDLGILVFDVTSVPSGFASEQPELLAKFLSVTAAANTKWNTTKDPEMMKVLATQAGMTLEGAEAALNTMGFPSVEEQLSDKWLGGNVQTFMKGVAEVFVNAGSIEAALGDYAPATNAAPLTAASEM